MSRELDLENLSEEDIEYIKQRPDLRAEIELQTGEDPLEGVEEENGEGGEEEGEAEEEEGEDTSEATNYGEWRKVDLLREIDRRNTNRDIATRIYPRSRTNADLARALEEDDA